MKNSSKSLLVGCGVMFFKIIFTILELPAVYLMDYTFAFCIAGFILTSILERDKMLEGKK